MADKRLRINTPSITVNEKLDPLEPIRSFPSTKLEDIANLLTSLYSLPINKSNLKDNLLSSNFNGELVPQSIEVNSNFPQIAPISSPLKDKLLYKFDENSYKNYSTQNNIPDAPEVPADNSTFSKHPYFSDIIKQLPQAFTALDKAPESMQVTRATPSDSALKSKSTGATLKSNNPLEDYNVVVSIPDKKLVLLKGNQVIKSFPALVGTEDFPTPKGMFKVLTKQANTKREAAYMGPTFLEFTSNHGGKWVFGLHGRGTDHDPDSTYGCVALMDEDISYLEKFLGVGNPVHVIEDPFERFKLKNMPGNSPGLFKPPMEYYK